MVSKTALNTKNLEALGAERLAELLIEITIADALGDVDAFIAQYDDKTRKVSKIVAEIARHLLECASLFSAIPDDGAFETHDSYVARLRHQHGRKDSFWSGVG